jgi:hypothetical protein
MRLDSRFVGVDSRHARCFLSDPERGPVGRRGRPGDPVNLTAFRETSMYKNVFVKAVAAAAIFGLAACGGTEEAPVVEETPAAETTAPAPEMAPAPETDPMVTDTVAPATEEHDTAAPATGSGY